MSKATAKTDEEKSRALLNDMDKARDLFNDIDELDGMGLTVTDLDLLAESIGKKLRIPPSVIYTNYEENEEDR